ncbi:MAG: hypothetical protein FJX74_04580, partial [Armatimonadetes bacterium]|nr:hypothetical protein [Armatimonadota bacterium]
MVPLVAIALTLSGLPAQAAGDSASGRDWRRLADQSLAGFDVLPDDDADGYGELAWGVSYGMMALNVLYEATRDTQYLDRQVRVIEQVLAKRDSVLAERHGPERYVDYQRGRVLQAWGTGHYSGGRHTCWAVHAGMLAYPMAEFARLVRSGGGPALQRYRDAAEGFVPQVEAALGEFDAEWREGPRPGQGYYVFPGGGLLPNNQMNAPGRALFALADATGKSAHRARAGKLAAFFRSKLTHVPDRDCYFWAYSQGSPEGPPGSGEDVSHAAINAHFAYLAWERRASFTDVDMQRLARTVTRGVYLGEGRFAATLGGTAPNDSLTAQIGRWGFLARFDPNVERAIATYVAAHPDSGALSGTTGALGFAYLLRAQRLGRQDGA